MQKKPYSLLRGSFNQQLKGVKCFALKTALPFSKKDEARRQKLRCQLRLKYFSISEFFVCIQFALHVYTSIITPYRCCRMSWSIQIYLHMHSGNHAFPIHLNVHRVFLTLPGIACVHHTWDIRMFPVTAWMTTDVRAKTCNYNP